MCKKQGGFYWIFHVSRFFGCLNFQKVYNHLFPINRVVYASINSAPTSSCPQSHKESRALKV